jgi:hypothetical protein
MEDFLDGIEETIGETEITQLIWDTADRVAASNSYISGTDLAILTSNILGFASDED